MAMATRRMRAKVIFVFQAIPTLTNWGKIDTRCQAMSTGHDHPGAGSSHSSLLIDRLRKDPEISRLRHRYKQLDDSYDLPYLGGYSKDGKIIYIDRHLPEMLEYRHDGKIKEFRPRQYLIEHESWEKALIDALGWGYDHSHAVATAAERRTVMQDGILWKPYQGAYRPYIKADEHEKLKRVPADLDLTPYLGDSALLTRMKKAMKH
jgi:hypothetical protein